MGTTDKGFRWPTGTDKVVDGDDAIHALATDVDLSIWSTMSASIAVPAGGTAAAAFTFPAGRFIVPPWIYGNAGASSAFVATPGRAQSATSATVTLRNISAASAVNTTAVLLAVAAPTEGVALAARAARATEPFAWSQFYVACVNPACAAFEVAIEIWSDDDEPVVSVTCGTCGAAIPLPDAEP